MTKKITFKACLRLQEFGPFNYPCNSGETRTRIPSTEKSKNEDDQLVSAGMVTVSEDGEIEITPVGQAFLYGFECGFHRGLDDAGVDPTEYPFLDHESP